MGKTCLLSLPQDDPDNPEDIIVNCDATSVRQLSEWGMQMVQAQFPQLTDILPIEEVQRQTIIHVVVLVYNFTTSEVGINQILNTYMNEKELFFGQQMEPWNSLSKKTLLVMFSYQCD